MSPEEEVLAEIQRVAEGELELTRKVTLDDRLIADLGLDSMTLTVLAVALEDRFRICLEEGDAEELGTVRQLVQRVLDKRREVA